MSNYPSRVRSDDLLADGRWALAHGGVGFGSHFEQPPKISKHMIGHTGQVLKACCVLGADVCFECMLIAMHIG